jgi:LPS-assembly protein
MIGLPELLVAVTLALPLELVEAPPPPGERVTFTVPFPEERGGGEARGTAASLEYLEDTFVELSGDVVLRYQDMELRAREILVDLTTKEVTATGDVILDHGPSRLAGVVARFNLETRTGEVHQAVASLERDFFFTGERVTKLAEHTYDVERGTFTSCRGEDPAWSFGARRARVELGEYASVRGASMRVRNVPVLYLPYVVWPTRTERTSGFLVPNIGHSSARGSYLGLAYYQVLGPSWDTTLHADLFSNEYVGLGNELRYHPREGTEGALRGYAIRDPEDEAWRWKLEWDHVTTDLPLGIRGVVHLEDYSDFRFFQDFERQLQFQTRHDIYSNAFATGNWGRHSLNLQIDRRQRFVSPDHTVELRQLPEIQYRLRRTRIGRTPLYLAFEGNANYFSVDRTETYRGDYGRLDLEPQIRLPLSPAPWLSTAVTVGSQLSWYSDSLDREGPVAFSGESLTRLIPWVDLEAVGPSFSRIFDRSLGGFLRFKHVIEPRLSWGWSDAIDEQAQVPEFDHRDFRDPRGFHQGRVAVRNSLLAKPAPLPDGRDGGPAREIVSLELARSYSFQDEIPLEGFHGVEPTSQAGPLELVLRAYPSDRFGLQVRSQYSLLFDQMTGIQALGNFRIGANQVNFSWMPRWQDRTGDIVSNQATMGWTWHLFPGRLAISSQLAYDFQRELLQHQRHFVTFTGSCYTLRLEIHETRRAAFLRRDYLFSIDLKNVGTFLDLRGGQTEGL